MNRDRVVAIGLLTAQDLQLLGPTFDRAWPVDDAPAFPDLIRAIDEADDALRREPAAMMPHPVAGHDAK
jgi:hypothetical protein